MIILVFMVLHLLWPVVLLVLLALTPDSFVPLDKLPTFLQMAIPIMVLVYFAIFRALEYRLKVAK